MIELLIESSLRTCMLAAIVGALLAAFRVRDPVFLHVCWTVVLVAMLAMPLLVRTLPRMELPILEAARVSEVPYTTPLTAVDVPQVQSERASPVVPGIPLPGLVWMYLAIALLLGTRIAIGYGLGIRLVRSARSIDRNEFPGQKANVRYLYSEHVTVPMTFGWLRPSGTSSRGFPILGDPETHHRTGSRARSRDPVGLCHDIRRLAHANGLLAESVRVVAGMAPADPCRTRRRRQGGRSGPEDLCRSASGDCKGSGAAPGPESGDGRTTWPDRTDKPTYGPEV